MGKIRHELWTFSKAQLSAQFATMVDFGLSFLMVELCGLWYVVATSLGAVAGGIVNCCINYELVFDHTGKLKKKTVGIRYFLVWCGSIILNTGGTYLLTELSHQYFIYAKAAVALCVALLWNYQLQRNYVYKTSLGEYQNDK